MDKKNIRGQIHNSMYQNIQKKGFVAPVDVLMDIGVLSIKDYENWRFGKIAFLERECKVNLHMLSEVMREMRAYAKDNNLKPSWTYYHQWGKHKNRKLRFSKSNDEKIEYNYATHFVGINAVERLKNPESEQAEE
jgi:hypothetical protein